MADSQLRIEQRPGRIFAAGNKYQWPTSTPETVGFDSTALEGASQVAADNRSDSLLVLRNGKLALERYLNDKTPSDVQQTYSGTKSLFSLLIGRCIDRRFLKSLDQPVHELVSEMPPAQHQLTFRNVLAMESGMEHSMDIEKLGQSGKTQLEIALERQITSKPFEQYTYNNSAYRMLFTALERASGMALEELTEKEVFEPLFFDGACWVRMYAIEGDIEKFTGYQSIRMTPRDFAKSAQVIIDGGKWVGEQFVPADYIGELLRCPAPEVNPSFGLFHFLNAGSFFRGYIKPVRIDRQLVPGAPEDLFLMFGGGGQVVAGIPSLKLVVVRTGRTPESIYEADNYIARLLRLISEAIISD